MNAALDTLFLPLETGAFGPSGRTLFIGAQAHPHLSSLKPDVWQPFKPLTGGLAGFQFLPDWPVEETYNLVLVHIPKQVDEAKFWIAAALAALTPGGWLVMAAANDANGNRLAKWMKELGLAFESESKNKARVVWAQRSASLPPLLKDWHIQGQKQIVQIGDGLEFLSQPGLFGWDKVDVGSKLLAAYLPTSLKGVGADFGAGTGYLSHALLSRNTSVSTLYVAEADARALDCAKENLKNVQGSTALEFLWADLSKPAGLPTLDFVLMNPPFHTGKKTEASLGRAFIETAAHHLKKGGRLYVVANAHLPYEHILRTHFAGCKALAEDHGFKIFEAVK